jgi:RNA polymerase sigma factor (TIGR02999 family)
MAPQEPREELLRTSADQWVALLYKELRTIARRSPLRVSGGDTLQTTALINEAYTHVASGPPRFGSRGEFLRYAALAMRHILIDRVREQLALKRGGGTRPVPLDEAEDFAVEDDETVLAVHESLERLAACDPRLAEIVQCRYFAGYDEDQTAEALGISTRTVQRDWATARAWLKKDLSHPSSPSSTE